MLPAESASRNKRTRGETRFPGLCRHAAELDVHRNHLWLVLTGRRKSKSLLSRYKTLLKAEGTTIPKDLAA